MTEQTVSIIAIHGNGGGGFRFDIAKPLFPSSINFLTPSLPGFNCEEIPSNNYSMKQYAEWIANYLKDVEQPRILMGHGLGGVFVLEFLQSYSDMVSSVILHSIAGANLDKRILPKLMKLPYVAWLIKNTIAHPITRPIISRKIFQRKIDALYEQKFFEAFGKCDAFEQMFNLIDHSWFKSLSPVNIPAAFLWGENDWMLKTNEVEAFQKLFPFNYKDVVPDWDHFPMITQPERYALKVTALAKQLLEHTNVFK